VKVAFFGTPDVSVPSLRALDAAGDLDVVAVVTNPDRPRGRSRTPQPPPVKRAAEELGLPVLQPQRPREIIDELRALGIDIAAVVAYGALLPREVLDVTADGFVNLHFSLLPRWRGAAPVQHALRAGDAVTGITTFVLDEGMDTGPVIEQVEVDITGDETAGELLERLAELGADVLVESLRRLHGGERPTSQPQEGVTYAPKITPEDVVIDWQEPAGRIADLVRSADPAPGAHTTFRGDRLKVWGARPLAAGGEAPPPGTVLGAGDDGVVVGTGGGSLALTVVQPAGKARMDGTSFVNGYQPRVGERLGAATSEADTGG
jgi:methionyl-tRNA formyltransferase